MLLHIILNDSSTTYNLSLYLPLEITAESSFDWGAGSILKRNAGSLLMRHRINCCSNTVRSKLVAFLMALIKVLSGGHVPRMRRISEEGGGGGMLGSQTIQGKKVNLGWPKISGGEGEIHSSMAIQCQMSRSRSR